MSATKQPSPLPVLLLAAGAADNLAQRLVVRLQAACLLLEDRPHLWVRAVRDLRLGGCSLHPQLAKELLAAWKSMQQDRPPTEPSPCETEVHLSAQELRVMRLSSLGCSYSEIATTLGVSRHTVLTYVRRCFEKLGVNCRAKALHAARRQGLLED